MAKAPEPIPYASPEDAAFAAQFFKDHAAGAAIWSKVVDAIRPCGPFQVVATKSRVAALGRTRFLWCNAANEDGSIHVRFLLPYAVASDRVRHDELGNRYSIRVVLKSPADVDSEAAGWFREAYQWDARGE